MSKEEKLSQSHLVAATNIRKLGAGKNVFYASKIFSDLNNRQLTSLMTISEQMRNDQNTNFKISCFCKECEKSFIKSDNNDFYNIEEITEELLWKTFGIYHQEIKFNRIFYNSVNENPYIFDLLKKKLTQERDLFYLENLVSLRQQLNNKTLKYYNHSQVFTLIDKPFIECMVLSFYKDYFYLIVMTNKNNKLFTNVITNDSNYPSDDHQWMFKLQKFKAAIELNKYIFYSEDFHKEVKIVAQHMNYDYYNNNYEKLAGHPLIFPQINYFVEIEKILKNYLFLE